MGKSWKKRLEEAGKKKDQTKLTKLFKKVEKPTSEERRLPKSRVVEIIDITDKMQFPTLESVMDGERPKSPAQKAPSSPIPNLKRTIEYVLSPRLASLHVSCDSPPAKIIKSASPTSDEHTEIDEESAEEAGETTEGTFLTETEIDKIIASNHHAIGNGHFSCPIPSCGYVLTGTRMKANGRRRNVKLHLNRHKAEKPFVCDEQGCSKKFTNSDDLNSHKRRSHPVTEIKCPMSGCKSTYGTTVNMLEHLLFICIQPDFAFCKECKMRIASRKRWTRHWTSDSHKRNCELLQRRGEVISAPPTQDINVEMKKAAEDPVNYKHDHSSVGLLGSVSPSTTMTSNNTKVERIQPFDGFIPTPNGSLSGVVWCSEMDIPVKKTCHGTILHNLLSGPQEKLHIPVTTTRPLGPVSTIYEIPVVSSSTCTDEVFNYVITCRKHTATQGTRGVGMVLDGSASVRFKNYVSSINKLKEAREQFELEKRREITLKEFKALDLRPKDEDKSTYKRQWGNCRKYRHFAAKDCSIENLMVSIPAAYPNTKEGRNNCILGEAYYQYAINSCDEGSGGLDETPEYENHEKRSDQLSILKVRRGEGTKKEKEKFQSFVYKEQLF